MKKATIFAAIVVLVNVTAQAAVSQRAPQSLGSKIQSLVQKLNNSPSSTAVSAAIAIESIQSQVENAESAPAASDQLYTKAAEAFIALEVVANEKNATAVEAAARCIITNVQYPVSANDAPPAGPLTGSKVAELFGVLCAPKALKSNLRIYSMGFTNVLKAAASNKSNPRQRVQVVLDAIQANVTQGANLPEKVQNVIDACD